MNGTDASSVQITINVVDANSGEVVSKVTKSLKGIGDAGAGSGKKLKQGLSDAGEAGTASGKKIADGMDKASGHSLNALDNVRLVRDDLGIRIPRAMEKVISQSKLAMGAIGAIGGGLIALGGIEVLVRLGQQVYELYERWLDTNKAVKEYREKSAEAAQQKLFDDASFDSTIGFLKQANQQVDMLQAKKTARQKSSLIDNIFLPHSTAPYFSTNDDKHLAQGMEVKDRESLRELQKSHELMLQNIDAHEKLSKASANSGAAIAVERRAAKDRDRENRDYTRQVEQTNAQIYNRAHDRDPKKYPGTYQPSKQAGQQEFDAAENNADLSQRTAGTELALQQQRDLMKLKQEADNVGLAGEKLLMAQQVAAMEELDAKYKHQSQQNTQYALEEAEIHRRFHNEDMQHLAEQEREVRKRIAVESSKGLTGIASTDARASAEKGDVDEDLARGKFYGNKDQQREAAAGMKGAIDSGAASESTHQQEQFNDRLAQLDAARADHFESEGQRIQSAADRSAAEILKAWKETYGQLDALDQRRVQSSAAVQAEIVKIQQDAEKQRRQASQRVEDETVKMEREGSRAGTPKANEQTQAILDEYNDRYQHLEELRAQDAENADKYRRQEIAAEQIKNGKLLDQQREMRDKLSGELQGLFSNPLEALKRQGEQIASKAAATYIMKIAKAGPGQLGTDGKRGGGIFGGFLGDSLGIPGVEHYGGGRVPLQQSGPFTKTPVAPVTSASSTLNAATATIHISNATITGLSGGGGMRNAMYSPGQSQRSAYGGNSGTFGTSTTGGSGISSGEDFGTTDAGMRGPFTAQPSSSTLGASSAGTASASSSTGGSAIQNYQDSQAGMPSKVSSVIGNVNKLPGLANDTSQLAQSLGVKGGLAGIAGKIPGGNALTKLAGNSKVAGAAGGALGLFSAFEGGGGFGGALQGGLAGAQFGAQFGGPIGAAIGGAAGAIMGFIGFGARSKAAHYDRFTVKPQIQNELRAFEGGASDYQTVYDDFDKLSRDAKIQTRSFGSGAKGYYEDTIAPEIRTAQQRLTREQKAGRSQFGMTAAQFHMGGMLGDFGSMATSPTEGFFHGERGEVVLNQQAAMSHGDVAMMMNSGASRSDIASYYGAGAGTAQVQPSAADVNLHFHSADAKGARQLLMDNKHHVRAALNSSYDENSGGADFV